MNWAPPLSSAFPARTEPFKKSSAASKWKASAQETWSNSHTMNPKDKTPEDRWIDHNLTAPQDVVYVEGPGGTQVVQGILRCPRCKKLPTTTRFLLFGRQWHTLSTTLPCL